MTNDYDMSAGYTNSQAAIKPWDDCKGVRRTSKPPVYLAMRKEHINNLLGSLLALSERFTLYLHQSELFLNDSNHLPAFGAYQGKHRIFGIIDVFVF
jgi:hypothetical protein